MNSVNCMLGGCGHELHALNGVTMTVIGVCCLIYLMLKIKKREHN